MIPSRRSCFPIASLTAGLLAVSAGLTQAAGPGPTFTKNVAPILFARCSACHRPGEVGPFALLTYRDAAKRAGLIAEVVGSKAMPPWKPESSPGEFRSDRTLDPAEVATLIAWAQVGAPEGDPKDLPPTPSFPEGWHLGEPDLVLEVAEPYEVPASGPDQYVHFVLPLGFDHDRYLRAVQVLPSNRRVAHHGVPILDGSGMGRALARAHGGGHYPNFGGPGFLPRGFLPGYAPGQTTRIDSSDDRGLTLAKGVDVVLQMHYHPTGRPEVDRPRVGLYFATEKPARNPHLVLMASEDVDIPAGAKTHTRSDAFILPVDFEVRDVWGHLHMIGKAIHAWAELPGGSTRELFRVADWDFQWQDTYAYARPFVLPKGTMVRVDFTWDNSAENPRNPSRPPRRVTLGEGSTDEMTGLILGGVTADPKDEGVMWLANLGHILARHREPPRK